jgi:hypothetical protein
MAAPVGPSGGQAAVVPVPLVAIRRRRAGAAIGLLRLLAATSVLLSAMAWATGGILLQIRTDQAATAGCTALTLDRHTGQTYAGPCVGGASPRLPATLTALLRGGMPADGAAAR